MPTMEEPRDARAIAVFEELSAPTRGHDPRAIFVNLLGEAKQLQLATRFCLDTYLRSFDERTETDNLANQMLKLTKALLAPENLELTAKTLGKDAFAAICNLDLALRMTRINQDYYGEVIGAYDSDCFPDLLKLTDDNRQLIDALISKQRWECYGKLNNALNHFLGFVALTES